MGKTGDERMDDTTDIQVTKQTKNDGPNLLGKLRGKMVRVFLACGEFYDGKIEAYSRYEIVISQDNGDPLLIFKHAILLIQPLDGNPFKIMRKENGARWKTNKSIIK
jgi:sRNA-binding regulator protein Hfq